MQTVVSGLGFFNQPSEKQLRLVDLSWSFVLLPGSAHLAPWPLPHPGILCLPRQEEHNSPISET